MSFNSPLQNSESPDYYHDNSATVPDSLPSPSIAERRVRRKTQNQMFPDDFQLEDVLPQSLISLLTMNPHANQEPMINPSEDPSASPIVPIHRALDTPRNVFGLFRQYFLTLSHPMIQERMSIYRISQTAKPRNGDLGSILS